MTNKHFEDFYFSDDEELHQVTEVQKLYKNNNGNYSPFFGKMFCPECIQAKLSFTHKTLRNREYLSKLPSSRHSDNCSYINEYAKKREILEYVQRLDERKIHDKLEAALNLLFNKKEGGLSNANNKESEMNPFVIETRNIDSTVIYKTIRRKSLNTWLDENEKNRIYIFYGRVKLEVSPYINDNGETSYTLIIKTKGKDGWTFKTKIWRNIIKDDILENEVYEIAILGMLDFTKNYPVIKKLKGIKYNPVMIRKVEN